MLRCPRCRTNDRTLLRFGVYLCPSCGETDPDGVALAVSGEATPVAVSAVPVGVTPPPVSAFASPPPPPYVAPGASSVPERDVSPGAPRILVLTVGWMVALDFVGFVLSNRTPFTLGVFVGEVVFLFAVLSGSAWARTLGLFSAVVTLAFAALLFVVASHVADPHMATALRVIAGLAASSDIFWIYVLMRADVTAYFARNAR